MYKKDVIKKTNLSVILLLSLSFFSFSQDLIVDNLSIEVLKTKDVSRKFNVRSLNTTNSKLLTKVLTRCKIESLDKAPVDINAFSLVDTNNKIRYKVGDFKGYRAIGAKSKILLSHEVLDDDGKPYNDLPTFDPNHKDSFYDYRFEGYQNIAVPMNFGSWGGIFSKDRKPRIAHVHYDYVTYKKFTAEIYFYILAKPLHTPRFELYYGKQLVKEIVF